MCIPLEAVLQQNHSDSVTLILGKHDDVVQIKIETSLDTLRANATNALPFQAVTT
jgi:hypothetical protein